MKKRIVVFGLVGLLLITGCAQSNGKSAYELAVANGFVGTEKEWIASLNGETGLSAYEIAVKHGFVGTEEEWLKSFKDDPQEETDKKETSFMEGQVFAKSYSDIVWRNGDKLSIDLKIVSVKEVKEQDFFSDFSNASRTAGGKHYRYEPYWYEASVSVVTTGNHNGESIPEMYFILNYAGASYILAYDENGNYMPDLVFNEEGKCEYKSFLFLTAPISLVRLNRLYWGE